VLDKATSELVERSTFQAYGAAESDYRPARWAGFREDYRFTGKEEDVEVGLVYFGKRYYAPLLNRWVSADPLTIHALGADLNVYAYVNGKALKAIDPFGLCENDGSGGCTATNAPGPDTGAQGQGNIRSDYGDDPGVTRNFDVSVTMKFSTATAEREVSRTSVASVMPQSALQRAVVYEDYRGSSLAQTAEGGKQLELAQDISAGVAITAASIATAGSAGTLAAGYGLGAGASGAVGGAAGGAVSLAGKSTYELRAPTIGEGVAHVGGGALLGAAGGKAAEWGTTKLLQWTTSRANAGFAANPGAVAAHVSPRDLATAAEHPSLMPAIYGKAMESAVAKSAARSPILKRLVEHVGGPGRPDFSGKGWLRSTNWDVTTPGQAGAHLARPGYGKGLNLLTYIRPSF